MDHSTTHKLKVQELRHELAKRGLDTSGYKPDLVGRLDAAIKDESESKDKNISSANTELPVDKRATGRKLKKQPKDEDRTELAADTKKVHNSANECSLDEDGKDEITSKDHDLVTMANTFTVQELRDELEKRSLDTSGRKSDLVARLNEAIQDVLKSKDCTIYPAMDARKNDTHSNKQYREKDNKDGAMERKKRDSKLHPLDKDDKDVAVPKKHKIESVGNKTNPVAGEKRKQRISKENVTSISKDENDEPNSSKHQKATNINDMILDELRRELSIRGLSTSGTKNVLVGRLGKCMDEMPAIATRDSSSNAKLPSTSKDENEEPNSFKHQKATDINDMTLDELRRELSIRGLSTSGTKKVLIGRLGKCMDEIPAIATRDSSSNAKPVDGKHGKGGVEKSLEENIAVATKKGSAVLDKLLPDDIKSQYHVLQTGDNIYDAMLNQTNVCENNNKFYVIQALEADSGGKYMVYNRWGRVGVRGQDKLFGPFVSRDEAISEFESKFWDKTKNSWSNRHNFIPYPNKYTWLEMDYEGDNTHKQVEKNATNSVVKCQPRKSKLDDRLAQFISLICNVSMMKQQMMEIGYNAEKLPLGKLSKSTILKGYEVLKGISVAIENQNRRQIEQLSSEFYTVVPHDFGFRKMREFIIDNPHKLKQKLEMVEALGEIELATKLLKDDTEEDEDPLYSHYQRLHCNILPLDEDSEDVAVIKCYLTNTHAKTHSNYTLEILHVFKVSRDGEYDCFEKFSSTKNRMLLWHGSRLTNWTGILSQGLRIAPPEAPVTGYMFGKGVYFADMVSKSANYCYAASSSPIGVLLLCEVALGDMVELQQANYNADKLPNGKLSTKGVGATAPDPSKSRILSDGVVVPLGTPKQSTTTASLLYNEFIVYNVEQIRMRYIVEVKFNFHR